MKALQQPAWLPGLVSKLWIRIDGFPTFGEGKDALDAVSMDDRAPIRHLFHAMF